MNQYTNARAGGAQILAAEPPRLQQMDVVDRAQQLDASIGLLTERLHMLRGSLEPVMGPALDSISKAPQQPDPKTPVGTHLANLAGCVDGLTEMVNEMINRL